MKQMWACLDCGQVRQWGIGPASIENKKHLPILICEGECSKGKQIATRHKYVEPTMSDLFRPDKEA